MNDKNIALKIVYNHIMAEIGNNLISYERLDDDSFLIMPHYACGKELMMSLVRYEMSKLQKCIKKSLIKDAEVMEEDGAVIVRI